MKYILFIIAMVIGLSCWGQKSFSDTAKTIVANPGAIWIREYPKQDTIKVLMLVCDTATRFTTAAIAISGDKNTITNSSVWWQYGYVVKEEIQTDEWVYYSNDMIAKFLSYWKTKEYLDQNKKPLPKSIVVWITKEIK